MRVCLDNNILIWGIRQTCTPGQEEMLGRADALLQQLEEEKAQIMVPSVVLTEFLTYIPEIHHESVLKTFNQRFQIHPFDAQAGVIAAEIWRHNAAGNPSLKEQIMQAVPEIGRVRLKADGMILATAISREADILYTHDKALKMMAEDRITVKELPAPLGRQDDFLGN